jgi:hypothetical protein
VFSCTAVSSRASLLSSLKLFLNCVLDQVLRLRCRAAQVIYVSQRLDPPSKPLNFCKNSSADAGSSTSKLKCISLRAGGFDLALARCSLCHCCTKAFQLGRRGQRQGGSVPSEWVVGPWWSHTNTLAAATAAAFCRFCGIHKDKCL